MLLSTGFILRFHANQCCHCRQQTASRVPRLVRYNALDFANAPAKSKIPPAAPPHPQAAGRAGRGCYADATATARSCAKELRPFGIPRAALGSSVRGTVRRIAFHMLSCVHEKCPESTVFRTLFTGVTTGAHSRSGTEIGTDLVPPESFAGADFFF